jgi:hypothetical protein
MKLNRLLAAWRKALRRSARPDGGGRGSEAAGGRQPTPIYVSARVLAGIVALVVAAVALFLYAAPTVPVVALGGMALAIVLSFPVRALSHVMPRPLAILVTVLGLLGLITLALFYLVPLLIQQLRDLVVQVPIIANQANRLLLDLIDFLDERQLLPSSDPEEFGQRLVDDLFDRAQSLTENVLRGLVGFIPGHLGSGWPSSGCSSSGSTCWPTCAWSRPRTCGPRRGPTGATPAICGTPSASRSRATSAGWRR